MVFKHGIKLKARTALKYIININIIIVVIMILHHTEHLIPEPKS